MEKPKLVIFAGANGSGVSTLRYQSSVDHSSLPYISAEQYILNRGSDIRGYRDTIHLRDYYLDNNMSFMLETPLSSKSDLDAMRRANHKGYDIQLYYIGTESPGLNQVSIFKHNALGGPFVEAEPIYNRSLRNLETAVHLSNKCHIYNNTDGLSLVMVKNGERVRLNHNLQNVPEFLPENVREMAQKKSPKSKSQQTDNSKSKSYE